MTRAQLEAAWSMGKQVGSAHEKFSGEMAKKTAINRACKVVIRASDDSYLADVVDRQELLTAEAAIDAEADEKANRRLITFADDDELVEGEVVDAGTGEILDEESAITAEADERLAAAEEAEPVAGPGF
jgi:recombination protein RecT